MKDALYYPTRYGVVAVTVQTNMFVHAGIEEDIRVGRYRYTGAHISRLEASRPRLCVPTTCQRCGGTLSVVSPNACIDCGAGAVETAV